MFLQTARSQHCELSTTRRTGLWNLRETSTKILLVRNASGRKETSKSTQGNNFTLSSLTLYSKLWAYLNTRAGHTKLCPRNAPASPQGAKPENVEVSRK